MPRLQATHIHITSREEKFLRKYTHQRTSEVRLKERAEIILLAWEGKENNVIARMMRTSNRTVKRWRNRWKKSWDELQTFAKGKDGQGIKEHEFGGKILEILRDAPRPGTPPTILKAQKEQIRAMACEKPEKYGYPFTHWSEASLAKAVIAQGIVHSISSIHVGRILKKRNSTP